MASNGASQPKIETSTTHPTTQGAQGPARIVLVGRTGLDGVLAAPASTELVRVRSGTDALGEVSAWAKAGHSNMGEQVVVLGEAIDADPTLRRARQLVEALRRLDPRIRVLAVGRPLRDAGEGADVFDGWLDIDDPVFSSRVLLHGQRAARSATHEAPAATRPVEVQPPPRPAPPADDSPLVDRLLAGEPIESTAVDVLSSRLGVPVSIQNIGDAPAGPGRASLPGVEDRVLVGPRATGEALETAAAWLAGWLRLEARQNALVSEANTDPLTGACNRRYFDTALATALQQAGDARRDVSVLVFDIDDFKRYNDEHGHDAGDEILREVVKLLKSVIRPTDKVCRIGGDEFAVIFDDPSGPREPTSHHPRTVVGVARRFQKQVATKRFAKLGEDAPGRLTISGGLATFPWDGLDGATLVRAADQRALESKHQGKNAIELGPAE
ncbi:MAG: diguanylate cyclase domain-containing protein [Phycisphaerales bacterium JB060]